LDRHRNLKGCPISGIHSVVMTMTGTLTKTFVFCSKRWLCHPGDDQDNHLNIFSISRIRGTVIPIQMRRDAPSLGTCSGGPGVGGQPPGVQLPALPTTGEELIFLCECWNA
jgi:hypothetical protein